MTSRPNGPGREPQRSFSSTSTFSRPSPHRTLSQQLPSSSPSRRTNDGPVDLTLEGDGPGRQAPRIGTSKLRVEVSTDSKNAAVESPAPISETAATWKPLTAIPPRGRPMLHFNISGVSNVTPRSSQVEGGQEELFVKPLPLPVRPGQHALQASGKSRSPMTSAIPQKKEARPKPYILETPSIAPHYSPNGHADFFPWTGNHAEDQFSEPAIRQGYFDKGSMTQNETGSARPAIFPALKLKTGLQTLSSLFTNVLAQRRGHGQITSASTFKPPPRVTVTDTKREMWLKDLANPTISLRRLSRSIPHGIRGKVLLDQSLSKNIPIERAVWLAKCVGANELRSFRRKGVSGTFAMGGEAKWIRDFTVCVEQFVESIAGTCGETDFRTKIDYAIRLATRFHAEHLLDRDHYIDWLVASIENSPQARLPIWLLITEIYWKDILQYRKYGRRLATSLVHHFSMIINSADHDILSPLLDRLVSLLKRLMNSNPESFIFPRTWLKSRDILKTRFSADTDGSLKVLLEIDRRNSHLDASGVEKEVNTRRQVIALLDGALSQPTEIEPIRQWWNLENDKDMLIQTVLEWACSMHRPGTAKIYVASRILRIWCQLGADITAAILGFIDPAVSELGRSKPALYHLVSELARSQHFSIPRYLQWLIARGGLHDAGDMVPEAACCTRLLAELPAHNLSDGMSELRMTLLNRVGFSVEDEEEAIKNCMVAISAALPNLETSADHELLQESASSCHQNISSIPNASRTCKSELGLWLRQKIRLQMLHPPVTLEWNASPVKSRISSIDVSDFAMIRAFLEQIDDYSILADVIMIVANCHDAELLASCTDTIILHEDIFSALGAIKGLFDKLMSRLRNLSEEIDPIPRNFLLSLSELAARVPGEAAVAQQLTQEVLRSDRRTAADVCSPISDHMALVEPAEGDFTDEIERILAGGTSLDQVTLERLFQRTMHSLEASWQKSPDQQRACGLLLSRLRTFAAKPFDALMNAWVKRLLVTKSRPSLATTLSPLVSFGCLSMLDVVQCHSSTVETTILASTASELLLLLADPPAALEVMNGMEAYRLRIKQFQMQNDHPAESLSVIREALASCTEEAPHSSQVQQLIKTRCMQDLLRRLVLSDANSFLQKLILPLLQRGIPKLTELINAICDELLVGKLGPKQVTTEVLLNAANDLSLPFCQVKLATLLGDEDPSTQTEERSERLDAFDTAIKSAAHSGNTAWASIVPLLETSIAQHLRHRAEQHFLALFPSPKSVQHECLGDINERVCQAQNVLRIINATMCQESSTPSTNTGSSNLGPDIVAACNGICLLLSGPHSQQIKDCVIADWLPLLLSFVALRSSAFDATKLGHESRARTILTLTAIYLQLQGLDLENQAVATSRLTEQVFDLALFLVDGLSEDMRQQCVRSLRDSICSPGVSYLLSYYPNPSEWLVMAQKERIPVGSVGLDARGVEKEKLTPFVLRRWENLGEPTPNVGENDTSLSLTLFGARRG